MKPVAVYIATTEGAARVERITRERAAQSIVCRGRSTALLPISDGYDAFVRGSTGVIDQVFGPFPSGAFRLDVSGHIETGDSWQLGAFAAHALQAEGALCPPDAEPDQALWLSGQVLGDLTVAPVNHFALKIEASRKLFARLQESRTPLVVLLHPDNAKEIDESALPATARIVPVTTAKEIFLALGLPYRRLGRSSRTGKLRSISLGATAVAGIMFATSVGIGTFDTGEENQTKIAVPKEISIADGPSDGVTDRVTLAGTGSTEPVVATPLNADGEEKIEATPQKPDIENMVKIAAVPVEPQSTDRSAKPASLVPVNQPEKSDAISAAVVSIITPHRKAVAGKTGDTLLRSANVQKPEGSLDIAKNIATTSAELPKSPPVPQPKRKPENWYQIVEQRIGALEKRSVDPVPKPKMIQIAPITKPSKQKKQVPPRIDRTRPTLAADRLRPKPNAYKQLPVGTLLDYGKWNCIVTNNFPFEELCRDQKGRMIQNYAKFVFFGAVPSEGNIFGPKEFVCNSNSYAPVKKFDRVELPEGSRKVLQGFWPLAVGKSAKFERTLLANTRTIQSNIVVAGESQLVFQGRERQVFLIKAQTRDVYCSLISPTYSFNEKWWYAPELGTVLKYQFTEVGGSGLGNITHELKRIQLPATPKFAGQVRSGRSKFLTAEQIKRLLAGRSLESVSYEIIDGRQYDHSQDEDCWIEHEFSYDGRIETTCFSSLGSEKQVGQWTLEQGNLICMKWPSWYGGKKRCARVVNVDRKFIFVTGKEDQAVYLLNKI